MFLTVSYIMINVALITCHNYDGISPVLMSQVLYVNKYLDN